MKNKNTPSAQETNKLLALFAEGRFTEATIIAQMMTLRFPLFGFAWKALGAALMQRGRTADALSPMQKAAALLPNDPEAHFNLGVTLKDLGRLDEAEASYRRALQIKPDYTNALNNIALLFNAQGNSMMALSAVIQSMRSKETGEAKSIFASCVKRLRFTHEDNEIRTAMVRALNEAWGQPNDLAPAGIELVKLNPDIRECIERAAHAWPRRLSVQDLFGSNGINGLTKLASDPLLCALLNSVPICDIEMERFLTMARHALLETTVGMMASDREVDSILGLCSALAHQCFINEYVFSVDDDEIRKVNDLRDSLIAALENKSPIPTLWPLTVATYFPLGSLSFATRLFDTNWPEEVTAVLVQQVREPAEEQQLRATIPQLTSIEDEVSLLVQNQYEENPYPRWVRIASNDKPMAVNIALRKIFPLAPFQPLGKTDTPEILIAGCGTGQHSIRTARRFLGARVLAVDLSLSSLSYAKRKSHELGLASIEYAQADLLKLGALDRSFDIIESSGVLHHLADPFAGWQVLLSLLRPGGVMKLGFYSEAARRNIVRVRNYIAEQGYRPTANDIRQCRQNLVGLDQNADFGTTLKSSDFFSTSTCRDLLFHVQEHRLTLTDIEAFLHANHLTFLGFEIEQHLLHAYRLRFPDDYAATNLGQWQIFENENPDTFFGMYQFWIQNLK